MNIVKERRKRGAVCPRCKHPDYIAHPPVEGETLKPYFRCNACGHIWEYGKDGGMYAELADSDETHTTPVNAGDDCPMCGHPITTMNDGDQWLGEGMDLYCPACHYMPENV